AGGGCGGHAQALGGRADQPRRPLVPGRERARVLAARDPAAGADLGPRAKAVSLAARIGDGYISTSPDAEALESYVSQGGTGPKQGGFKVCWGRDEAAARKTAFELWPNTLVPGQLSQELALPSHFEQASQLVTEDKLAATIPCGPDPERHLESLRQYLDAGFDEVYVSQIGNDQAGFFEFYRRELAPRLS
ncbi:MAG TPA: LLM class F420-dependent oxidoreductase, partial [Actinomycetes bacterium]|nr:LLM class F420-dependent oxidoreductase [Actinomycetes bacterium]